MKTYNITNKISGADLGNYEGHNKMQALDAMARDAGYKNYTNLCSKVGYDNSFSVTEIV